MSAPTESNRNLTYICEMMERLGIEPGGGVVARLGLSYATAFHRCKACPSKQACREWLDSMPRSVAFAPHFCPNADILFELEVNEPSLNHVRSHIESDYVAKHHAHITDLKRLEDEIDEVLLHKSADDSMTVDLKCRKLHLRNEIEWFRSKLRAAF
jgi:hypothetical protein